MLYTVHIHRYSEDVVSVPLHMEKVAWPTHPGTSALLLQGMMFHHHYLAF